MAQAQVGSLDKCAGAVEKESQKLLKDALLRLSKCNDRYEKELGKGVKGSIPKAGDFCEKMLSKTIDVSQGPLSELGKDKLSKFFKGMSKARDVKCDEASPRQDLGHGLLQERPPRGR